MAKKKRTKQTQLQKDVKKQLTRINRLIKKYEKEGFDVTFKIPEQKRYTKQYLEKLKNINYIQVLQKSYKVDIDTGQIVSGWGLRVNPKKYEHMNIQSYIHNNQQEAPEMPEGIPYEKRDFEEGMETSDYDLIINNFLNYLDRFPNALVIDIKNWLKAAIQKNGKKAVAYTLYNVTWGTLENYLRDFESDEAVMLYDESLEQELNNYMEDNQEMYDNLFGGDE